MTALGAVSLAWGNFDPGQPVPKDFPHRTALAYAAGMLMLIAGAAINLRRTTAWAAAALAAYYALIVVIVLSGRLLLAHLNVFGNYSGTAEQLAIAAAAVIVYAARARIAADRAAGLIRCGQLVFAVCTLLFGGAHFFYMNLTAPLVPPWLPPSQEFWGYATGLGHIAAGLAILTGVRARLAAMLLNAMYCSFTLLVHVPLVLADPSRTNWSENALNLALIGVAWVVADSLARPRGLE